MDILASITEQEYRGTGEIPVGFLFALVKNTGSRPAIINSVALAPGEDKSYPFIGKPYRAIPFNTQGSTLRVMYVL
ncbi:hypothetical protein HN014_10710 [Aquimarina sp. TRL1]|uniref:hypothetical protein n=1 Tax=Aquimarina sp. (strain TRL1) TaxID=2736252 RepID=UPI00158C0D49|nr:hypothetical protein [Aquimarina sp. TRL1]QKX05365.1 hypothetical protein HN014_10710 [Aquimarina sp. TRL1]